VFVVTKLDLRLGIFMDAAVDIIAEKFPISTAILLPYAAVDNTPVELSPVTDEARQSIVASKACQFYGRVSDCV